MQEHKYDETARYEVIGGKTVYMSPRPTPNHNIIITNIVTIFNSYLKGKKCRAFVDGIYIRLDKIKDAPDKNNKDRLIPDAMIVCDPDIIKPDGIYGAPDLVVEVSSPSTVNRDKIAKKDIYEKIGVKEYWIVSPKERFIEVYLLKDGKYILDNVYFSYSEIELEMFMDDVTVTDKTVVTEFKTSLYDDLIISIADVFDKLI